MDVLSSILTILLCIRGLETTYPFRSDDRGLMFQQQMAQAQERIINTNPSADTSVEETGESDKQEEVRGVKCTIGRLFYLDEEGELKRCHPNQQFDEEEISSEPLSPHFILPGLPSVGLSIYAGAKLPGAVQLQNIDVGGEEKKPLAVKPVKPALVKPIKLIYKPKLVHKPLVHKHMAHPYGLLHITMPGLGVYHQTGLESVNHEGLRGEPVRDPSYMYGYPYWYFMQPHRGALIQKLPAGAEKILGISSPAQNMNYDEIVSDQLNEDEDTRQSGINENSASNHSLVTNYRTQFMVIDTAKNTSINGSRSDQLATNRTNEIIAEPKIIEKSNSVNVSTQQNIEEPRTGKPQDEVEQKRNEVTEEESVQRVLELALSGGPDVMEDADVEQGGDHIRRIREAPAIPIDTLSDQQSSSSSILDRNTLLHIMSSLKEQYLKNAEPDQRKLIEDAFDRLHCSVRDMKKLDERPSGKKIDGPKKATLKLLAERAQPLIEEPDYYSDATDDVSAEPSFLELLNVATKHKGKQSSESD